MWEDMRAKLFQHQGLEGFAPLSLEVYLSEYDIEMEGSLMISGMTSRFRFMNSDGEKIHLPRTDDKVLAYSFFIDQGDEWEDILDKLTHYKLINSRTKKAILSPANLELWRELTGLTPARFELISKLVEDGVRPSGAIRRRQLARGECLSLGLTLNGSDEQQRHNYSNLFFAGLDNARYVKMTVNNIYFSMAADSEAPTIAAFEVDGAPVFLYSDPKISLHTR